jgi:hypothetical protein
MVSAEEQAVRSVDSGNLNISINHPQHIIPDNYLKNSKPAEWLPESEMVNIILSQKILERYNQNSNSEIIEIPITYLESKSNFEKNEKFSGYNVEKGIDPDESIVLIRMPSQLYETFIKEDVDGKMSLPSKYFCRFYSNFNDLSSHITKENGSVKISPSSHYPVIGLLEDGDNSLNAPKSPFNDVSSSASTVPQNYFHWATTSRISSTNYKYCIGQIRPYDWSLSGSGSDLFKIFQEREYKFNNGEALEIIAQYYDQNEGAGIELYPVLYRNGSQYPINTSEWSHWEGHIVINPNDIPHAYGFHVQTTNSGYGYQVNFEDMETLQWIKVHTVSAASTVSSFTEIAGSSEYKQLSVPSTGTFSATTNPVIDEWVIDVSDGWHKPGDVWNPTITMVPATPPLYVSVVPIWDNGNLITRSYADYP